MTDLSPSLPDGFRLIAFETVDSTNAEALRRIATGAAREGDTIWAHTQTGGRGRRGRVWRSVLGNLYMTLVVDGRGLRDAGNLSFVAAVAVGAALAEAGADPRFKWPNDILLGGRKAGGILIEAASGMFAVGIGVNLAGAPQGDGIVATSLHAATGAHRPPETVLAAICGRWAEWLARLRNDGFAEIRARWLDRAHGIGAPVRVNLPSETVEGIFSGLDGGGGLILTRDSGERRIITAGEVFFAEQRV